MYVRIYYNGGFFNGQYGVMSMPALVVNEKVVAMQVQEEMVRRANLRGRKGGKKRVYSSKYALSSIVYCGHCGDIYRRVHWNNRGYKSIVWRCVSRLEEKGSECTAPTINEETLQTVFYKYQED